MPTSTMAFVVAGVGLSGHATNNKTGSSDVENRFTASSKLYVRTKDDAVKNQVLESANSQYGDRNLIVKRMSGLSERRIQLISGVFFVSGAAALLYQVTWQRLLFLIYGTNSKSIAAIVAAFMAGLGIGSLIGGLISKRNYPLLAVFAVVELLSGLFGLVSVPLLKAVGEATSGVSPIVGGVLSFSLVLVPTILMGSTLPLLTAYFVRHDETVGSAVGDLYQMNTLGSAVACVLATIAFFPTFGLQTTVYIAVLANFLVAIVSFVAFKRVEA